MPLHMDNVSLQKTYAQYGVAMYWAQEFEEAMLGLLSVLQLNRSSKVTRARLQVILQRHDRKTLGQLLNKVTEEGLLDGATLKTFDAALDARNLLAHGFFRRMRSALENEDEFKQIAEVLSEYISVFKRAEHQALITATAIGLVLGVAGGENPSSIPNWPFRKSLDEVF